MEGVSATTMPMMFAGADPASLAAQTRAGGDRAIEKAATGFESMFLSLMLKEMRQTLEPDTLFGPDSGDVLGGLFDMFLSQYLAPAGALGIASMVRKQLNAQQAALHRKNTTAYETTSSAAGSKALAAVN
jgi:flagellar protein FlgJ